ncbi:aminopeptidase N [Aliidiomarina celeris]|uniref:aminopeptidase N n=1 Tax=Aliidiomarina celeris TaxID=2249428 RepID=UPI000DEA2287|nr:aminopeptidase N [Aliidiomarina celeris]
MSKEASPLARFRKDYNAPAFQIETVDLHVALDPTHTIVTNVMRVKRLAANTNLELDGEQLKLVSLEVNGQLQLEGADYERAEGKLILRNLCSDDGNDHAEVKIVTEVNPSKNSALEGLYLSGGAYCTQCEAEGFRRITYYLDRPDVLAVFTTTIEANQAAFPYLLSNGNKVAEGICNSDSAKHWVTWHDPHPKPCYLFALVAGDFDRLQDAFVTRDQRRVLLELFVDKGNLDRAQFAMESLKNAMRWDEERFGLVYDLDIYMIVAVDFFNMGAMENKGLNVFNAKYVLANPETATDQDFLNVESVIGHEYFHNWTGNRITCRDWFQLSLKEGLTVFRDQEFSADRGMRAVNRIQDVRIMRTHQFEEDAGPMAHPIRPDKVVEMNNFYTVTVYNKGAEVIRMLHTLLGEEGFQAGMREYVKRHDGQAVTCEDFVVAMEAANDADFTQFRRWYSQAGTPTVEIEHTYCEQTQTLRLMCKQSTPATPGQSTKLPFHIPIRIEMLLPDENGSARLFTPAELPASGVIELTEAEQSFSFNGLPAKPVIGFFADFSAPVKVKVAQTLAERILLTGYAVDPFLRWNAVQDIYIELITRAISEQQPVALPELFIETLEQALAKSQQSAALTALLFQVPTEEALASEFTTVPFDDIHRAVNELQQALAEHLAEPFWQCWQVHFSSKFVFTAEAISSRMLCNTVLPFLARLTDHALSEQINTALWQQFNATNSMTLVFGALQAAVHQEHASAAEMLHAFAEKWAGNALVMDKWLAVQGSAPLANAVERVQALQQHKAFEWGNPNRVYALLASFSHNPSQLHRKDGAGYLLMAAAIERLNTLNPQVASRLLSSLLNWKRLDSSRQPLLKAQLEKLRNLPNLAPDLFEKIEQSLND